MLCSLPQDLHPHPSFSCQLSHKQALEMLHRAELWGPELLSALQLLVGKMIRGTNTEPRVVSIGVQDGCSS